MNKNGVTLTELIIVVAIIGILAVALGFTYVSWQGAYKVEKETKELYFDLMTARGRAMNTNRMHFVRCISPWRSYDLYADTSNGTNSLAGGDGILQTTGSLPDTLLPGYPKAVDYAITWGVGTGLGRLQFDTRGLISTTAGSAAGPWTLYVSSTSDPDYDCIIMTQTRINMGKWNTTTGVCDAK